MFIPFDAPAALFYFSGNATAKGGSILPLDPVSFSVVPREGKYYLNGNPNPPVTLTRGAKFSFVIRNEDQRLFPIVFGSSFGNPYTAAGAITVAEGGHIHTYIHTYLSPQNLSHCVSGEYSTMFTVQVADPSVSQLVYYCQYNPLMTGRQRCDSSHIHTLILMHTYIHNLHQEC